MLVEQSSPNGKGVVVPAYAGLRPKELSAIPDFRVLNWTAMKEHDCLYACRYDEGAMNSWLMRQALANGGGVVEEPR
jgi:hypothetical protein